jgi:hypothetical protein
MAKSDDSTKQDKPADIDKSDTLRRGSSEARQQAIEKMKLAQQHQEQVDSQEATTIIQGDDDKLRISETDIDPKASKALKDLLGEKEDENKTLSKVKVYSPYRIYYDSVASSVSAVNNTGPFDVLSGHKNFLSLLSQGDIVVRSMTGKEETISIERGIMHVSGNEVRVFLDI